MQYELAPSTWRKFITQHSDFIVIGLLTLVYLLLPTRNSTLDAWYYAACVRHGHELFLAHHLLYNPAGWLWVKALQILGLQPDTLAALKALNALAAAGSLLVLRQLLRVVAPVKPVGAWLLLVGGSFGVLRFATENETYIQPLLLSLLGSLAWVRYQLCGQRPTNLFWAGFWAAVACLFHQIHFFWWLSLLLGTVWYAHHKVRSGVLYSLPALLVPAAYLAALPTWHQPLTLPALWRFVFHDYYAGTAGGSISGHGLLLSVINLVRTFMQLHGSTLALLRQYPALWLVGAGFLALLAYAAGLLWRSFRQRSPAGYSAEPAELINRVIRTHGLILGVQFLFAVSAEGNAEFMVMLPALLAIVLGLLPGLAWVPQRAVLVTGLALLLWNLAFGLAPAHQLRFANNDTLLRRIRQEPQSRFLLDNHNLVLNQLHYQTGQAVAPPNVLPTPTLLVQRPGQSPQRLRQWLREQRRAGHRLYTTGLHGPQLLDRAQLVYGNQNAKLLRGFQTQRVDSFATSFGPYYLTEIR
ncbi:hypothetical protein [Hymenobacter cellulosivorans]|uniref:Glycosyltransferase RgtA/B/C/D-like domain-containing protein n=1 Tax=Hymenobacter cellulosivorans TaxID=2932249 RepID=A0ABY4FDD4_9BACT|nr:hypothetical protein [Hymenobacter cellulosivorans]UOQ54681.1 hypothetical protein MUN80_07970 [Hymenobacter cellulosivorans]